MIIIVSNKKFILSSIWWWQGQVSSQLAGIRCIIELPEDTRKVDVNISLLLKSIIKSPVMDVSIVGLNIFLYAYWPLFWSTCLLTMSVLGAYFFWVVHSSLHILDGTLPTGVSLSTLHLAFLLLIISSIRNQGFLHLNAAHFINDMLHDEWFSCPV